MGNSCNVILGLCNLSKPRFIDTVRFALFAAYVSSLDISPHFYESE